MTDLILHQYELSPFSEKIRRILAFKKLPFRAVRVPAVMPKPDLLALTGGYRKVPVLQIGSDVYCDTALIARVLERLAPEPTLFPTPLAQALAEWLDGTVFETVLPYVARPTRFDEALRLLTPDELSKMGEDRAAMRVGSSKKPLPARVARSHLAEYLDRFERHLSNQPYFLSEVPSAPDFSAYHSLWLLEKIAPEPLAGRPHLAKWMERLASLRGVDPEMLTADAAIQICRDAKPSAIPGAAFEEPLGIERGAPVVVRAADYGCDPIEGVLVDSSLNELVLRREDARAGTVTLHFPRIGYEVAPKERTVP